jgi:hypothetical protein
MFLPRRAMRSASRDLYASPAPVAIEAINNCDFAWCVRSLFASNWTHTTTPK